MHQKHQIRVGDFTIGAGRTFVVAEIGSNHGQDLQRAFELIRAAKESGADAVKFQSINVSELYLRPSEAVQRLHEKIDLEEHMHYDLKSYCDKEEILFFSSPTYLRAVDTLEEIRVRLYKLASAQVGTFPQLVRRVAGTGKPVLLSTGIVNDGELAHVVQAFQEANNHQFVILHCNSLYPAPWDRVHLNLIQTYQAMFQQPVGFSDHTPDIYVSLAAVALGAAVIEKHFTLDRSFETPDAEISLEPDEYRRMVQGIRAVEQAMRPGHRVQIEAEENEFKQRILYRLILNTSKRKGEVFTPADFDFKRDTEGIDCRDMDHVVGHMIAGADLTGGTLLEWSMLKGSAE